MFAIRKTLKAPKAVESTDRAIRNTLSMLTTSRRDAPPTSAPNRPFSGGTTASIVRGRTTYCTEEKLATFNVTEVLARFLGMVETVD